jgi:hypothetical protein
MVADYERFPGTRHRNWPLAHRALSLLNAAIKPWRIHILADRNSFSLAEMSSVLQNSNRASQTLPKLFEDSHHIPLEENEPELG